MNKYFYPLVQNPFSNDDIKKGIDVLKSKQLTLSKQTHNFEKNFSKTLKSKYSLMVNSGSSANLLALQCLINPYRKKRLNRGDEIIIPTLCWSTSLWPIVQSNLKPVFVDINPTTLNIDENQIEKKITKKTKAILLVHVLGNSCDMNQIMRIKKKYNLILIEDNCESLGSKYAGKHLGTYGDFSSFTFYSSHQISSGEGGMICCKDKTDFNIIKSLRSHGWSRGTSFEKGF
jgi:CDP-6-deoxy-D-xylo-4-hexulose-3-dehydrase